jgi:hypothetical protein
MVMALFIAFSLSLSVSAIANGGTHEKSATELKFIGSVDNQPLFQLNLNNAEEDTYIISISDVYGNLLYSDRVKGINISKKFRFNTDEMGDETLRVKVRSAKSNKLEVYEIKRNSRVIEEATVSKL